jgi:hypothetical protein
MGHGGARIGAGRPKKNAAKGSSPSAAKSTDLITQKKIPSPKKVKYEGTLDDYHAMATREAGDVLPSADAVRNEVLTYIKAMGCEGLIPPNVIDDYVINRIGFLACEAMNRKMGRLTKDTKLSPYVTAANSYYRAMQSDFQLIMHTIFKFGGQQKPEEENSFLRLLMERGF